MPTHPTGLTWSRSAAGWGLPGTGPSRRSVLPPRGLGETWVRACTGPPSNWKKNKNKKQGAGSASARHAASTGVACRGRRAQGVWWRCAHTCCGGEWTGEGAGHEHLSFKSRECVGRGVGPADASAPLTHSAQEARSLFLCPRASRALSPSPCLKCAWRCHPARTCSQGGLDRPARAGRLPSPRRTQPPSPESGAPLLDLAR
jgi:hypothetical protein